jgi:hypothetical protein
MTPIADGYAVVSQNDGVLTLVDTTAWRSVQVLRLLDPLGGRVSLISPSSGREGVLYAVATSQRTANRGLLFAVAFDPVAKALAVRATWAFAGRSGASPVVAEPAVSGLSTPLVLLHAPGLAGETVPVDRLVALADDGVSLTPAWMLPLGCALAVAPTVEPFSQTLFYTCKTDTRVHQVRLVAGTPVRDFDIGAIGAMPAGFGLDGHLAATQAGTVFTLLLSGSVPAGQAGAGQYQIAFQPIERPATLLWSQRIAIRPDGYTAAWSLGPSPQAGVWCPLVVGTISGITRLCDF